MKSGLVLLSLLATFIVGTMGDYPVPKYYDLVLRKCVQGGFSECPNCNKSISWSIDYIGSMIEWEKPAVLAKCNLEKRKGINETNIMKYLNDMRNQLDKHWYLCGDCPNGSCQPDNPVDWMLTWANYGVCSNWTIPEYFVNGLLMYSRAVGKDFYYCCGNQIAECHIPHDPNLNPIGCYWPAQGWGWGFKK